MTQRKCILLTGATGLVGSGIARWLREQGHQVIGTSRCANAVAGDCERMLPMDLLDSRSIQALSPVVAQVDAVIHNAALLPPAPGQPQPASSAFFQANASATAQLLDLVTERAGHPPRPFVYISSTGFVRAVNDTIDEDGPYHPGNAYYAGKIAGELACLQADRAKAVTCAVLRVRAPYGPGVKSHAVMGRFLAQAMAGEALTLWGTGAREQTFTHTLDIGQACERAIDRAASGTFHIAGRESISMKDLAQLVIDAVGPTGARIVYADREDPEESRRVRVSIDKARAMLGYEPRIEMAPALRELVDILRSERAAA